MVVLQKRNHAEYVGTVGAGFNSITHKLREEWSYTDHAKNVSKCGKQMNAVMHTHKGAQVRITCKTCLRSH